MAEYEVFSDDVQITWQRIRQERIDLCQVGSMHQSVGIPPNKPPGEGSRVCCECRMKSSKSADSLTRGDNLPCSTWAYGSLIPSTLPTTATLNSFFSAPWPI